MPSPLVLMTDGSAPTEEAIAAAQRVASMFSAQMNKQSWGVQRVVDARTNTAVEYHYTKNIAYVTSSGGVGSWYAASVTHAAGTAYNSAASPYSYAYAPWDTPAGEPVSTVDNLKCGVSRFTEDDRNSYLARPFVAVDYPDGVPTKFLPKVGTYVAKPVIVDAGAPHGYAEDEDPRHWIKLATGVPAGLPGGYSMKLSGADKTLFDKAPVAFIDAPDYDTPTDANADNVYELAAPKDRGEVTVRYFYRVTSYLGDAKYPWAVYSYVGDIYFPIPGSSPLQKYARSSYAFGVVDPTINPAFAYLKAYGVQVAVVYPAGAAEPLHIAANIYGANLVSIGDNLVMPSLNDAEGYPYGGFGSPIALSQYVGPGWPGYVYPPLYLRNSLYHQGTFTQLANPASGVAYSNNGTTETFTLITTQKIWPLTQ